MSTHGIRQNLPAALTVDDQRERRRLTMRRPSSKTLLQVDSLSLAGSSTAWTGKLDLANNDLIIHTADALGRSVYGTTLSQRP